MLSSNVSTAPNSRAARSSCPRCCCGSLVLRFSSLLAELVPGGGLAFRVGGDEFALLLADAGEQEARDLIGRVRVALEGNIDPLLRSLIASFGIATNSSGRSAHELLQVADEAMYAAKRTGTGIEVAA